MCRPRAVLVPRLGSCEGSNTWGTGSEQNRSWSSCPGIDRAVRPERFVHIVTNLIPGPLKHPAIGMTAPFPHMNHFNIQY